MPQSILSTLTKGMLKRLKLCLTDPPNHHRFSRGLQVIILHLAIDTEGHIWNIFVGLFFV